jgi:uncharacterized damage-inducible protein DinB
MDDLNKTPAQLQSIQIVGQILNFWRAQNKSIDALYTKHAEEVYYGEVSQGRNSGTYLLAHLIATNDGLLPLFGLGERLFPELTLLQSEGESIVDFKLELTVLKEKWQRLNEVLEDAFSALTVEEWLEKHNSVSEEDFKLDPTRNRLNVLLNRASHQNYHRGQLIFLDKKAIVA